VEVLHFVIGLRPGASVSFLPHSAFGLEVSGKVSLNSVEGRLGLDRGDVERHRISQCLVQLFNRAPTRVEKVPLQGRLLIDIRVDVADHLRLLRHLTHHHHVEDVELLGRVDELPNGYTRGLVRTFPSDVVVGQFARSEVADQVVDADTALLVPLNQSASQLPRVLCVHVAREDRQQRQRQVHDDRYDAPQLVFGEDSLARVLV